MQGNDKGARQTAPAQAGSTAPPKMAVSGLGDLEQVITVMAARVERIAAQVPAQRLLSKRQAAALLGISRGRTLDRLIQAGVIKAVLVGRRVRIPMAELERVVADGAPAAPPAPRVAPKRREPRRPDTQPPSLERELAKARALKVSDL